MMNSLKQILLVLICAIVVLFYREVTNISGKDIPFWATAVFFCVVIPVIFTVWMFYILRPKRT